jgi:hypothetical protein
MVLKFINVAVRVGALGVRVDDSCCGTVSEIFGPAVRLKAAYNLQVIGTLLMAWKGMLRRATDLEKST